MKISLWCGGKKRNMGFSKFPTTLIGTALLVSACSFTEDALWPSLAGEDQQASQPAPAPAVSQPVARAPKAATSQPALGTASFQPSGVTSGKATGTFVGKKVGELRSELKRLQGAISRDNTSLQTARAKVNLASTRYHDSVSAINARLQIGTTPGNPILVQQFNVGQGDLDRLSADISEFNKLKTLVSHSSSMASFLSESTRAAFNVSGSVDEDWKQLSVLQDEVDQTVVLIERLLKEISDDMRRQTNYIASERANLNVLSAGIRRGEIYGISLMNQAVASTSGSPAGVAGRPLDTTGRRPLVVIRFDRENVPFQQALYNAVSKVLERRPDAVFDLVAVASSIGGQARSALNTNKSRRNAEMVLRSLVEMGLPPSRVAISAKASASSRSSEVHLYLR
jgi:hypothetical protein